MRSWVIQRLVAKKLGADGVEVSPALVIVVGR